MSDPRASPALQPPPPDDASGGERAALPHDAGDAGRPALALPVPEETWVSFELLQQAQAGDGEALDGLMRRYQERLRRVVRVRIDASLRGLCESADVVQETLAAALTRIGDLQVADRGAILRWFTRIAENEMIDLRRRALSAKRDRNREKALDSRHDLPSPEDSPPEQAASREMQDRVDRAVAGLPPESREVILQRTYCGESWEDVARAIGSPTSEAARKLHGRAMVKLARALLDERGSAAGEPD